MGQLSAHARLRRDLIDHPARKVRRQLLDPQRQKELRVLGLIHGPHAQVRARAIQALASARCARTKLIPGPAMPTCLFHTSASASLTAPRITAEIRGLNAAPRGVRPARAPTSSDVTGANRAQSFSAKHHLGQVHEGSRVKAHEGHFDGLSLLHTYERRLRIPPVGQQRTEDVIFELMAEGDGCFSSMARRTLRPAVSSSSRVSPGSSADCGARRTRRESLRSSSCRRRVGEAQPGSAPPPGLGRRWFGPESRRGSTPPGRPW